ncbi:MAG: hypothetical protein JWL62_2048 [Hyphomicrobiales bacterium]|nr:hypothetical protein [Hyphomicrobiales bacterium]
MMKNPVTGQFKKGFYGFSWTYLFFGWLVPLIRGELGIAALHFLFTMLTFGIWQLVFAFFYNKQFTSRLISQGYVFNDTDAVNGGAAGAIGVDLQTHLGRAA